jgi:hypothetical protein
MSRAFDIKAQKQKELEQKDKTLRTLFLRALQIAGYVAVIWVVTM